MLNMYGYDSPNSVRADKLNDELLEMGREAYDEVDALVKKLGLRAIIHSLVVLLNNNCDDKNPVLNLISNMLVSVENRICEFKYFDLVKKRNEPNKEEKKE